MNSTTSDPLLDVLDVRHPEWRPFLAAVDEATRESGRRWWTRAVPAPRHAAPCGLPLLHDAVIALAPRRAARWLARVLNLTPAGRTSVVGLTRALAAHVIDPLLVIEIAVTEDAQRVAELARAIDTEPAALEALMPLIGRPLLQACRRGWERHVPVDWSAGYCPICGGWPVLAEVVRGDEGRRRLRCGGCGGDWAGQWRCCPFCGERDHARLGSLLSAESLERHSVEVCDGCGSYVKTVMSLTPMSPDAVVLHDLTSLELDVAAVDRGYRRAPRKGHPVAVSVVAKPSRLRDLFGWG